MRVARFPVRLPQEESAEESAPRPGSTVILSDPSSLHHLTEVLRLAVGDRVEIFDASRNMVFACTLEGFSKDSARLVITGESAATEQIPLVLLCGLPRPAVSDSVVEKATEFGIRHIIFFEAERTQGRLKHDAGRARLRRWNRLAEEALKQSGGARPPEVALVHSLEGALLELSADKSAFKSVLTAPQPHICDKHTAAMRQDALPLLTLLENCSETADFFLIIGPEGGLTDEELELSLAHSFCPASLGPKVLRTETAAAAACACIGLYLEARTIKAQLPSPSSD